MLLRIAVCAALLFAAARAHAQEGARRDEEVREEPAEQPTLTRPPAVIEAATPVYPPEAAAAGLEAAVKVRIAIDATGRVTRAEVIEPVGSGFDEAAVAAAEQYVFSPAEFDGVPGPIVVETEIHFVLEQVEVEPPPPDPAALDSADPSHAGDAALPVSISGAALERGSRKPLAGVIVSIAELSLDAITDEQGRFYFHGVPPGDYRVLAFADDYERFERELSVAEGEAVDAKLYLRRKGESPYQTVVEGEREILEVTRRTLQRRQLTTVPGTFGDPIRVIQSLPGLARAPFLTGFLLIRGSNPDDSGVFIDGHRVPLLFHFLGGPSVLNAEFLDELHLYPGGFPARYGRAHGGIVAVDTRSTETDGVHGSADVDFLDASGYVRAPVGENGSFAIAGRRSYVDTFLDYVLPEQDPGNTLVVVPIYYDYQLRFDYDFGARHGKASVFYIASSDQLDVLSADPEAEEFYNLNTRIDFSRLIASYQRPIIGNLRLTLSPAVGVDSIDFGSAQLEGQDDYTGADIDVDNLSYRMRVDGQLGEHVYLDAGLDLESRVTSLDFRAPIPDDFRSDDEVDIPPERFQLNTDAFLYGLYADVAVTLGQLRLIPGLRLDGAMLNGDTRWSVDPRLVGRYTLDPRWVVKGYLGLFHQPPQPEALVPELGNPDLGLERAVHTGLGAEWRIAEHWLADGEIYFIDRRDLVEFSDEGVRDPDTGTLEPVWYRNSRIGDTIGLELLVRRELTENLYGWLSYTLSRTREKGDDDEEHQLSVNDQTHTLNAVASYRVGKGWELGGRFRLASGRPETAVVGSTFDADDGDYRPVRGELLGSRGETFHQLDLRAEKTWTFQTWRLGAYLDIQNVYNASNAEATQYDYRYRDSAPVTGVPFLPTLGLRGTW